jgi:hypothetical protein
MPSPRRKSVRTRSSVRFDERGFSFKFGRDDPRRDVEGKCATCDTYARVSVIQAQANQRFRCDLQGAGWNDDARRHFEWCRWVPRRRVAEEQRNRSEDLQRCVDRLCDFDDDRWGRRSLRSPRRRIRVQAFMWASVR